MDLEFATELHDVKEFLYGHAHKMHIAVTQRACNELACKFFEKWETRFRTNEQTNRLCDIYHEAKQEAHARPSTSSLYFLEHVRDSVQSTVRAWS